MKKERKNSKTIELNSKREKTNLRSSPQSEYSRLPHYRNLPTFNMKRDCSKNMTFFDTKDKVTKLNLRIVLPEYLVNYFQRDRLMLERIRRDNRVRLSFEKGREVSVSTAEGVKGSLVTVHGKIDDVNKTIHDLMLETILLEKNLNGERKI